MKKFISLMIVAVLLVSSLSVSAFAAGIEADDITGDTSHDVYAKYVAGSQTDTYKVVIGWGDMKFTYSAANEQWNTTDHKWDKIGGGWSVDTDGGDKITITNHSSKDVTASFVFNATATGITGVFSGDDVSNNAVTVGNALGGSAVTKTVNFTPKGDLDSSATTETSIGKITVTLD